MDAGRYHKVGERLSTYCEPSSAVQIVPLHAVGTEASRPMVAAVRARLRLEQGR